MRANLMNVLNSNDWCHLCGERKQNYFIQFTVPENAEHSLSKGTRGYFRFCQSCVATMYNTIVCKKEKDGL